MKEMYSDLYQKGAATQQDIRDIVLYMPDFGLTPLDYEEITGQPWDVEQKKTE